jgi:DNA-binding XRE family transcriptional regulator
MKCNLEYILGTQGRKKGWLAEQVAVSRNTITAICRGTDPHLSLAYRISKTLNVPVQEIWPE